MKLHQQITISSLVVGHTKFSPDWCFGLFKHRFKRTSIISLNDIVDTVNNSAVCNVAQLVADSNGQVIVPTYDWKSFLEPHFRKLQSIKKYHHFRFSSDNPSSVFLKVHGDSEEKEIAFLKSDWDPRDSTGPNVIQPPGLSPELQWYLYERIRQFCPDNTKDIVCPLPSVPHSSYRPSTPRRPVNHSNHGCPSKRRHVIS